MGEITEEDRNLLRSAMEDVVAGGFFPTGLVWSAPDHVLEAAGGPGGRAQRANKAAADVGRDYSKAEAAAVAQLLTRLNTLKTSLQARLLDGSLTDFKRYSIKQLADDVDRMIADAQSKIHADQRTALDHAGDLGTKAALEPMRAAQLNLAVTAHLPGLDAHLVHAAFDNTVDLLTPPMQQYAGQVKTALRAVALAGDQKFEAIQRLASAITGGGFDNAQYRAERIIRTELGRVFSQSTYDRMVGLTADFPFLRKGWKATNDGRTRLGHVEAGQKYAKGQGSIPIATMFEVAVYNERDGKVPVRIGTASLRFPLDPMASPAGRVAAGATIMCRCNSFVDFNLAEFAAFTKAKVQQALGQPAPMPAPEPAPPPPPEEPPVVPPAVAPPVAAPDPTFKALGQSLKNSLSYYKGAFYGTQADMEALAARIPGATIEQSGRIKGTWVVVRDGLRFGPEGFTEPPVAKPKPTPAPAAPTLPTHPPAVVVSAPEEPPAPKVSERVVQKDGTGAKLWGQIQKALGVIDTVHDDGTLPKIPAGAKTTRRGVKGLNKVAAYYMHGPTYSVEMGFGPKIMTNSPNMAVFHESGHWLDHMGIGVQGMNATAGGAIGDLAVPWSNLLTALQESKTMQTLRKWSQANLPGTGVHWGQDGVPWNIDRPTLMYMLQRDETFARAYAQYITVRSGDPAAMRELRLTQAAAGPALAGVPRESKWGAAPWMGGTIPEGTWTFPWAWQDAEFEPIAAAFDEVFGVMGWRKKKK